MVTKTMFQYTKGVVIEDNVFIGPSVTFMSICTSVFKTGMKI